MTRPLRGDRAGARYHGMNRRRVEILFCDDAKCARSGLDSRVEGTLQFGDSRPCVDGRSSSPAGTHAGVPLQPSRAAAESVRGGGLVGGLRGAARGLGWDRAMYAAVRHGKLRLAAAMMAVKGLRYQATPSVSQPAARTSRWSCPLWTKRPPPLTHKRAANRSIRSRVRSLRAPALALTRTDPGVLRESDPVSGRCGGVSHSKEREFCSEEEGGKRGDGWLGPRRGFREGRRRGSLGRERGTRSGRGE